MEFMKEGEEDAEERGPRWVVGGGRCRHINGFQVGVFPAGPLPVRPLTASTNARETVRAAKEVLMKEEEEYLCGGVTTKVAQGWNNTVRTPSSRPVS